MFVKAIKTPEIITALYIPNLIVKIPPSNVKKIVVTQPNPLEKIPISCLEKPISL